MFKDNTIRKEIMKVLDAKIETAQKEYDTGIETIDIEAEQKVKEVYEQAESNKVALAKKLVDSILSKIL